jgi:hypothetical protein
MEKRKRKNLKHSYSEKMRVVELYNQGYGSSTISKEMQISETVSINGKNLASDRVFIKP